MSFVCLTTFNVLQKNFKPLFDIEKNETQCLMHILTKGLSIYLVGEDCKDIIKKRERGKIEENQFYLTNDNILEISQTFPNRILIAQN